MRLFTRATTKTTAIWFVGVVLVTAFSTRRKDGRYFERLLLTNLSVSVIVEFVGNLHTFPLVLELVLVPLVVLFVVMQASAATKPEFAQVGKVVGVVLGVYVVAIVLFSLVYVVGNAGEVFTRGQVAEFFLPLVLTAGFAPMLYAIAVYSLYDTILRMTRHRLRGDEHLYRFARRQILKACQLSLRRTQLFAEEFRQQLWGASTQADVRRVIDSFRSTWVADHLHSRS